MFDEQKKICLSKVDLSRKGSVDEGISELIRLINSSADFFTTSSCSGRVTIISNKNGSTPQTENASEDEITTTHKHKETCQFYMNSHEPISVVNFKKCLPESIGEKPSIRLKFEPLIFHIRCRDLSSAKKLHNLVIKCGLRNSGLTFGGKKMEKITLAVRSTLGMEMPLDFLYWPGDTNFIDRCSNLLIEKVNEKFIYNEELIRKFERTLSSFLQNI